MKSLMNRAVRFTIELVATVVVCAFIFAVFGGLGASLSQNHRYRV